MLKVGGKLSSIKSEVLQCFKENPELIHKRLEDIGEFFYLQGLLYQSNIIEALQNKYIHFQKHLSDADLAKANKSWDDSGI
jgi:hypothetical protein